MGAHYPGRSASLPHKRILKLIRRYLQAGAMMGGLATARREGTPQGGPLSPLLSNILLDELDQEVEQRGHALCRSADDGNIYVRSKLAGERVLASLSRFLGKRLRLRVNADKSAGDRPWRRKFLGYSMTWRRQPRLQVAAASVRRFQGKLREAFRRGRGRNLQRFLEEQDGWIRRRLRCLIWRPWKRPPPRAKNLRRRGLKEERAWRSATNGRAPGGMPGPATGRRPSPHAPLLALDS